MKANTHPPPEILIKVQCSEKLPSDKAYYHTNRGRLLFDILWYSAFGIVRDITYWYEPATRVVLTVEECEEISKKLFMHGNGLGDRDMINDNKPTDI